MKRRTFLKTTAATSVLASAPAFLRGQNLNSKLQFAAIGADGKGFSDAREMISHERVHTVGICDVDLARTARLLDLVPGTPVYQDYREMLDTLGDKVDAVTVSTPDHMHAYPALDAMRRGLHVYCQKPLTHTVWEARQVAAQAKKSGVITRLGNQIHSHEHYRTAVNAIRKGAIGKIKRVHSWVGTTGHGRSGYLDRPTNPPPIPDTLDWDLWLGCAPERPYGGNRVYHPYSWRDWQDFGGGGLGDFCCHILDPVFTALGINQAPTEVTAEHSGMNNEVWPAQTKVDYTIPGTELTAGETLHLTWYNGGLLPGNGKSKIPLHRSGSLLLGEEGTLHIPHVAEPRFYPEEKFPSENIELIAGSNHYHGWVDGCLSGEQPTDDFVYGALLTEYGQLGNAASHSPKTKLTWDAKSFSFSNNPDANKRLTKKYRKGWEIDKVT